MPRTSCCSRDNQIVFLLRKKFLIEKVVRRAACLMKCSGRRWLAWSHRIFPNSCAHSQAGEISFLILLRGVAKSLICLAFNWICAGKKFWSKGYSACMGPRASNNPRATSATVEAHRVYLYLQVFVRTSTGLSTGRQRTVLLV